MNIWIEPWKRKAQGFDMFTIADENQRWKGEQGPETKVAAFILIVMEKNLYWADSVYKAFPKGVRLIQAWLRFEGESLPCE